MSARQRGAGRRAYGAGFTRAAGAAVVAGALAVVLAVPAGASAAAGGDFTGLTGLAGVPADVPGLRGPVVTHPVQESFGYPAGEVCAFPSHADFPVSDLTTRTWTDAAGRPVFAVESGPLVMRVTNLATGKSVERDISGTGVITYPDPDSFILSGNDWSAGFHTGDHPHNQWIVAGPFMSVEISTAAGRSSRTLLALAGPYEDLCKTLA
ncbi:hypothetical protein [Streptomyces sp. NPDC049040]|uniref:hypothetical protein n=1 Tax=Streptomyces sp. NPDC049040 TaxID=3365593 RepID=UPI0037205720